MQKDRKHQRDETREITRAKAEERRPDAEARHPATWYQPLSGALAKKDWSQPRTPSPPAPKKDWSKAPSAAGKPMPFFLNKSRDYDRDR